MAEDSLDRVAMMAAEVRFHRDPFVGAALGEVMIPPERADLVAGATSSSRMSS
jgi:hypothetical protein